jgi:hypothetical protein
MSKSSQFEKIVQRKLSSAPLRLTDPLKRNPNERESVFAERTVPPERVCKVSQGDATCLTTFYVPSIAPGSVFPSSGENR